jgi:hypothetical protein
MFAGAVRYFDPLLALAISVVPSAVWAVFFFRKR